LKSKGFSLMETVIFIVLAAIVIPIFYLTTQPVIKDMMTPTSYIKARFVAEKKMEQLMAYQFTDTALNVGNHGPSTVTLDDTAFPAADYGGYQWQWAINWLGCGAGGGTCTDYTFANPVLSTTSNPGAYTFYKQIDLTVRLPGGQTYQVTSAVTARY
jgi:hypothetical protein